MDYELKPFFDQHKNLLFLTNPLGVLNCVHIFGDNILEQGRLRSFYVTDNPPDPKILQEQNFTLLDAKGDDGVLTKWMMEEGFYFPMHGSATLCLPAPSWQQNPFTIKQIKMWLECDPSLVEKLVYWDEHYEDHGITCIVPFPSYIDALFQKGKIIDMEGCALCGGEYNDLKNTISNTQALWNKSVIQEGMGEIKKTSSKKRGRVM